MPDKDDKNSGHTSQPGEYERNKQEVHEREAGGARNTEHDGRKESKDVEEARNVPASKQG
ncbi:hypothetical protein DAETH_03610 [Deinococcus aetherius]|uniref:Uncharacterized protein n=1 Tax=Deinococcus aetherius TaxID=200252 RepID=A0ABM8A9J5_9DEIO|nr:hypothetical protein [Deinococcus aetherius]BDP40392.1 hypothetical protein DAETH_03610 [Deinococcus aetherius]